MKRMMAILCLLALAGAIAASSVTHAAAFGPRQAPAVALAASPSPRPSSVGEALAVAGEFLVRLVFIGPGIVGDDIEDQVARPSRHAVRLSGIADRVFDR
jgi:hypothetical protein